jgi:arylsulfatase A-like enzyme
VKGGRIASHATLHLNELKVFSFGTQQIEFATTFDLPITCLPSYIMTNVCVIIGALALAVANVPPTIVHVIADDLGFNDLGFSNGGRTYTPNIDAAVHSGISLTSYHTYKVCSPTRASIMTGRYPWGVGYYDMKGPLAVPLDFAMLPKLLQDQYGYETHACGKWNLGDDLKEYTPTFRGFDSFVGYYAAAQRDYWYHGHQSCQPSKAARNESMFFWSDQLAPSHRQSSG